MTVVLQLYCKGPRLVYDEVSCLFCGWRGEHWAASLRQGC